MTAGGSAALAPGFDDPGAQSQIAFRAILEAMSRPGRIVALAPPAGLDAVPGLSPAAAAVALTLLDLETPVWLDASCAAAGGWLRFRCGCPLTAAPDRARFAFARVPAALPALDAFDLGSAEYPDRSTTLVLDVAALAPDAGRRLTGPGIADAHRLAVGGLPEGFWAARAALADLFPRGLDVVFTAGARLAALPRTTRAEG